MGISGVIKERVAEEEEEKRQNRTVIGTGMKRRDRNGTCRQTSLKLLKTP